MVRKILNLINGGVRVRGGSAPRSKGVRAVLSWINAAASETALQKGRLGGGVGGEESNWRVIS